LEAEEVSRSGYYDDYSGEEWWWIRWRGAVASAINGRRGQAFLREMREALDAMEPKELIAGALVEDGKACAIGSVALRRGIDVTSLDPEDAEVVANTFGIARALAAEIAFENDEAFYSGYSDDFGSVPAKRWEYMRRWVEENIKTDAVEPSPAGPE
jgi:hypothetical protein